MAIDDDFARPVGGDAERSDDELMERVRVAAAAVARASSSSADRHDDQAVGSAGRLLRGLDPARRDPDLGLAEVAVVYVSSALAGHVSMQVAWACYARATRELLCGPVHPFTVGAGLVLAEAYERCAAGALSVGGRAALYEHAAAAYRSLIARYEQLGMMRDADQARIRLAVCRHALGGCGEAIRLAGNCWQNWVRTQRREPADGCAIAGPYTAMLRLCGCRAAAVALAKQAGELLSADYAPGGRLFTLAFMRVSERPHESVCARWLTWDESR
jgi:hypothetical protein